MSTTYEDLFSILKGETDIASIEFTALSEYSDSEKLAKLAVWMERRKPSVTLAQCDRYDYFYESFLLKTVKSLFVDYLDRNLNRKKFSELEIKQHTQLCTETIKDLNKHTKLLSAEIKHTKKWFYGDVSSASQNSVLEEARKLLINLYDYLENANEHKIKLFYLKDFYTTNKFTKIPTEFASLNTEIAEFLNQYQAGASIIGDKINEGKIAQWLHKIEREIENCRIFKTDNNKFKIEIKKIYEKCQDVSKKYKRAMIVWEDYNIQENLRRISLQLENCISKMEENNSIDIFHYYYKFCIEEFNVAFNKMEKIPELAEGVDDLIIELQHMLNQPIFKVKEKIHEKAQKETHEVTNEDHCADLGDLLPY